MEQLLFLGLAFDQPRRLAVAQQNQRAVDQIERFLGEFGILSRALGLLLEIVDAFFQ